MIFTEKDPETFENREICGGGDIKYILSYPFFEESSSISAFYSSQAKALERDIISVYNRKMHFLPQGISFGWEVTQGFDITYGRNNILSVYRDTYENMPPWRVELSRRAETWSVSEERRLSIDELFGGRGFYDFVGESLRKKVREERKLRPGSFYGSLARPVPWKWNLSERGLIVWFDMGSIAPDSCGIPSFLLTFRELEPFCLFHMQ